MLKYLFAEISIKRRRHGIGKKSIVEYEEKVQILQVHVLLLYFFHLFFTNNKFRVWLLILQLVIMLLKNLGYNIEFIGIENILKLVWNRYG